MSDHPFNFGGNLCREALRLCVEEGVPANPRGKGTLEVPHPVHLTLGDAHRPFMSSKIRRANYRFGLVEACWVLAGSRFTKPFEGVNSRMAEFSDDGRTLWGAYGPRVMGQLDHVLSTLRRDPDSRQAVVTTWRPMVAPLRVVSRSIDDVADPHGSAPAAGLVKVWDANDPDFGMAPDTSYPKETPSWDGSSWRSKDVPCTVAWQFLLRQGRLNLTVFMRSNDAWLGLPYDLLTFTTVQRVVASALGVEPGAYHHLVGSLHLYDENLEAARAVLAALDTESEAFTPVVPEFGGLFAGFEAHKIAGLFGAILGGRHTETVPALQPFADAVRGSGTSEVYTFAVAERKGE